MSSESERFLAQAYKEKRQTKTVSKLLTKESQRAIPKKRSSILRALSPLLSRLAKTRKAKMFDKGTFLKRHRRFLRKASGLPFLGELRPGLACQVEGLPTEETHGDVVHPCVRFIEKGFEGRQWWMVYTPYYGRNPALENPILCYGDAEKGKAPTRWTYYCEIKKRPEFGYNSDPTLLFYDGQAYVFWRENYTKLTRSLGCSRATIGCRVHNREIDYFQTAQLIDYPRNTDREVSPTFLQCGDAFRAYAVHMRFCSKLMYRLPPGLERRAYRLLDIANKLGVYSRFKSRGAALWKGDALDGSFEYVKTLKFKGVNWLYHPWHMDIFDADTENEKGKLFAIVQTNPQNADICLAYNDNKNDKECFRFYKRPLVTNETEGIKELYKPSALVVDGVFHLFYTALDSIDPQLNRLFVVSIPWKELLTLLQQP